MIRKALVVLGLLLAFPSVKPQTYETSMATVPFFSKPYNLTNPPLCNVTFLGEFSSGVWDWIHGLIEFAIRANDFSLDQFTMSDQPYARYLELLEGAKDEEERKLIVAAANTCKTCKYLGCYVWCSPRFCTLCPTDDDDRRRNLRSASRGSRQLQNNATAIDYNLLALKISDIVTGEARQYLQAYDPRQYACMGVASGLQIIVTFIPYT